MSIVHLLCAGTAGGAFCTLSRLVVSCCPEHRGSFLSMSSSALSSWAVHLSSLVFHHYQFCIQCFSSFLSDLQMWLVFCPPQLSHMPCPLPKSSLSPTSVLLVTNSCLPFRPGFRSSLGPYLPRTPVRLLRTGTLCSCLPFRSYRTSVVLNSICWLAEQTTNLLR